MAAKLSHFGAGKHHTATIHSKLNSAAVNGTFTGRELYFALTYGFESPLSAASLKRGQERPFALLSRKGENALAGQWRASLVRFCPNRPCEIMWVIINRAKIAGETLSESDHPT